MTGDLKPEDLLHFLELRPFTRRWESLGLDDEEDLSALQFELMADPNRGAVIKDTHGLRKMRFSPPRWATGKSGAIRVLYVHFQEFAIVLLVFVYGKNELDNISAAVKKSLNKTLVEIENELRKRQLRGHQ